jgi:gliding motility-associated-like protein/uncharacterized repeat protein (TIGR01451 family)
MFFTTLSYKVFGRAVKNFFPLVFFCCWFNAGMAQLCATIGLDGPTNIAPSINTYYAPLGTVNLPAGATTITLSAVPATDTYGNNFGTVPISSGDLILVIQMQDATINSSNSKNYGSGSNLAGPDNLGGTGSTSLGSTGKFEYLVATNSVPLTGGVLTFKGLGPANGTVNAYFTEGPTAVSGKRLFQIIRVTQYSNLRLSSNIYPPPFNGTVGGIVAFEVAGAMDFNGFTIDVSARGFRGGYSLKKIALQNYNDIYVMNTTSDKVSGKGEGIAGTPRFMWDGYNEVDNVIEGLPGGSGGIGAPANAGGGGNDTNAGGGGGGNGGFGGVGGWGYEVYPGLFPNGGRPGAAMYPTGPLDFTRLIMGGGGGGGHANDATGGVKGGVGGGIVLINAGIITGTGSILANGGNGAPGTFGGNPDGSGGGGAGGTVFVRISNPNPTAVLNIQAKGGNGGNTEKDDANGVAPHGPGGGGGGGIVYHAITAGTVNVNVDKGKAGITNNGAGSPHHAEDGRNGVAQAVLIAGLPSHLQGGGSACYPQLTTTMSVVNGAAVKYQGDVASYAVTITNTGTDGNAGGVQADCLLPAGFIFQSATATYTGAAGGPATITNLGTADRPRFGNFNISAGDAVTIVLNASINCGQVAGTYNASAQAVYLDPTRNFTDPTHRITAAVNAFAGANTTYQGNNAVAVPGLNFNGGLSSSENITVMANGAVTNNTIAQPNPDPPTCNASIDPTIINGSVPVGGNGNYTYQWQSSADGVNYSDITTANGLSKDYDPPVITSDTYYRRIASSGLCVAQQVSNALTISINTINTTNSITSPAATTICSSASPGTIVGDIPSNAPPAYSYQWQSSTDGSNFATIAGATGKDLTPVPLTATTYFKRTLLISGCAIPKVSNVVVINVSPPIVSNVISAPALTSFCGAGNASVINGNAAGSGSYEYQWQASTDGVSFSDITAALSPTAVSFDPPLISVTTYYRRKVTTAGCGDFTYSNIIAITIGSTSSFTVSPDATICNGSNTVLTAGGGTSYTWSPSEGLSATNIASPVASPIKTTVYTVNISNGTCTTPLNVTVNVVQRPVVDAGADKTMLSGDKVQLKSTIVSESAVNLLWSPSTYLDDPTSPNPISSALNNITYTLTATSANNCFIAFDNVSVKVYEKVVIPNTFTPNGDGVNDTWDIIALSSYQNSEIKIFNRYGVNVFKSVGYSKPWDGTYKDKPVAFGTYYYIIDLKNESKILSGSLSVVR